MAREAQGCRRGKKQGGVERRTQLAVLYLITCATFLYLEKNKFGRNFLVLYLVSFIYLFPCRAGHV